ncbi:calcium-binding protein (plasmid) [Aliiroseovarius crassostreae]|uniref:Calcium-binding protein n=1 Tax=Aliiroseovarius crassostreae TaxID=154981 RepID=A0A9Q9HFB5_9RHOB|nr:calcium-binding protein [Aliiroseovarius crassostreae]UWP97064.1 calcium-binding protein [Aliiroseovarius crassostreae]
MEKISLLAATVVLSTASVGIALADTNHGHGDSAPKAGTGMAMNGGGHDMMKMMQMHAGMMGGSGMGMMGMMDQNMMGMMMGDGAASPEKAREQLQAMHSSFDANKDGTLSIEEFEMLHSSMIRNSMVDRFQHLDADGDGKVTAGEMTAPADRMGRASMMSGNMKPGAMMDGIDTSNDEN